MNDPFAFNTLLPPVVAVYHPSSVYPVLLAVGNVASVDPSSALNTLVSFVLIYTVPPPDVPVFLSKVSLAFLSLSSVSDVVALVIVDDVFAGVAVLLA